MNDKNYPDFDPRVTASYFKYDYHDRGMLRWRGFYLSDHTSALKDRKADLALTYPPKRKQTLVNITEVLAQAFAAGFAVSIQLNERDMDDNFLPDVTGKVAGYNEDALVLTGGVLINLDNIRHVEHLQSH